MGCEAFLADPVRYVLMNGTQDVEPEWVRLAWEQSGFKQEVECSLIRSVSKIGGFGVSSGWLNLIKSALPPPAAIELYQVIRDGTKRSESEWRGEFVAAFPNARDALPDVLQDREFDNACRSLFHTIYVGKLVHVEDEITEFLQGNYSIDKAGIDKEELAVRFPRADFLSNPQMTSSSGKITPLQFARMIGRTEVCSLLERYGATK